MQLRVLAFVLAGGKGTRLYPLTKERAKPAVPFGGRYRIVDFVLSNLVNSGIYSIYVLVQFKSQSLLQHLARRMGSVQPVAESLHYSRSRSDAVPGRGLVSRHRRRHLSEHEPDRTGRARTWWRSSARDHIYRMNIREMVEFHVRARRAGHRLGDSGGKRAGLSNSASSKPKKTA